MITPSVMAGLTWGW